MTAADKWWEIRNADGDYVGRRGTKRECVALLVKYASSPPASRAWGNGPYSVWRMTAERKYTHRPPARVLEARPIVDDERVAFDPGPHHCDQCKAMFQETPWAFPLMDLRFPEGLRFCSDVCLGAYRVEQAPRAADGLRTEEKT